MVPFIKRKPPIRYLKLFDFFDLNEKPQTATNKLFYTKSTPNRRAILSIEIPSVGSTRESTYQIFVVRTHGIPY